MWFNILPYQYNNGQPWQSNCYRVHNSGSDNCVLDFWIMIGHILAINLRKFSRRWLIRFRVMAPLTKWVTKGVLSQESWVRTHSGAPSIKHHFETLPDVCRRIFLLCSLLVGFTIEWGKFPAARDPTNGINPFGKFNERDRFLGNKSMQISWVPRISFFFQNWVGIKTDFRKTYPKKHRCLGPNRFKVVIWLA